MFLIKGCQKCQVIQSLFIKECTHVSTKIPHTICVVTCRQIRGPCLIYNISKNMQLFFKCFFLQLESVTFMLKITRFLTDQYTTGNHQCLACIINCVDSCFSFLIYDALDKLALVAHKIKLSMMIFFLHSVLSFLFPQKLYYFNLLLITLSWLVRAFYNYSNSFNWWDEVYIS